MLLNLIFWKLPKRIYIRKNFLIETRKYIVVKPYYTFYLRVLNPPFTANFYIYSFNNRYTLYKFITGLIKYSWLRRVSLKGGFTLSSKGVDVCETKKKFNITTSRTNTNFHV